MLNFEARLVKLGKNVLGLNIRLIANFFKYPSLVVSCLRGQPSCCLGEANSWMKPNPSQVKEPLSTKEAEAANAQSQANVSKDSLNDYEILTDDDNIVLKKFSAVKKTEIKDPYNKKCPDASPDDDPADLLLTWKTRIMQLMQIFKMRRMLLKTHVF